LSERLRKHLDQMRQSGELHAFNREYKARRRAALERGQTFMSYKAAMARLRRAVVAHWNSGRSAETANLYIAVFGRPKPTNDAVAKVQNRIDRT
jgi:hypothetical protein